MTQPSDEQLSRMALEVLNAHLGPARTMRFLSLLRSSPRDYQAWRDAEFGNLTAEELIRQMRDVEAQP